MDLFVILYQMITQQSFYLNYTSRLLTLQFKVLPKGNNRKKVKKKKEKSKSQNYNYN